MSEHKDDSFTNNPHKTDGKFQASQSSGDNRQPHGEVTEHYRFHPDEDVSDGHFHPVVMHDPSIAPSESVSIAGGTSRAMKRRPSISLTRPASESYDDVDRVYHPESVPERPLRNLKRENRLARFITHDDRPRAAPTPPPAPEPRYIEPIKPQYEETTQYTPEPTPVPYYPPQQQQPPAEPPAPSMGTRSVLSTRSSCVNPRKVILAAAILTMFCAIFNFVSYFGPWTVVVRDETGSSGVISWHNRWQYDFHPVYVHSHATGQDFAYRNSDGWYRQCHSNGTWAAIVFGVLALVVALVCMVLLFRHHRKQGDRVLLVAMVLNVALFVLYFFSLGFWVLGCHATVNTYMDTGYATPATTVTNDIAVNWGFGLMLLAWLLSMISTICTIVAWKHRNSSYTSTYIHSPAAPYAPTGATVQPNTTPGYTEAYPVVYNQQDSVSQPGLFDAAYADQGFIKPGLHHRSSVQMETMPTQLTHQQYGNQLTYEGQAMEVYQGQQLQQQQDQGVVYSAQDQPQYAQYDVDPYQQAQYGQGDPNSQHNMTMGSTAQSSMYAGELDDLELQMAMNGLQDNNGY